VSLALAAALPAAANTPVLKEFPAAGGLPTGPTAGVAGLLGADHGETFGHLPQTQSNVELISKLELVTPGFGPVAPSQVADVSVHKNTAYLTSWSQPFNPQTGTCERGGVFSVDISNPAAPKQLAFRPALPGNYHGEGAHTITFPDGRDILAVNNEYCTDAPESGGGFALYDVSNPADPVKLVDAAGDYGKVGDLVCCSKDAPGANSPIGHDYHSVFMWVDDGRVYLIGVDNAEQAQTDVDIFDITDPSAPVAVREYDLDDEFPIVDGEENGLGDNVLFHDMVVKEIDGIQTLLASYWDGGYVLLNVEDPANATYIGDTRFDERDPLTGVRTPEGNAHQAEFSHDNQFILAADEDFDAFRVNGLVNPGAADEFEFRSAGLTVNDQGTAIIGPQVGTNRSLTWDTRYVGTACNAANIPAATGAVRIAIVNVFNCAFRDKTEAVEARGYRGMIMFSPSNAEVNDPDLTCDNWYYLGGYDDYLGDVITMWVPREVGFRMMGLGEGFTCGGENPTPMPTTAVEGVPVDISAKFDGWGYAHLYRYGSAKLEEVGKPFAISEGIDERYATGFGDLSIHEFATDPEVNLAYSSYYSGGLRVLSFGEEGLKEVGRYIDANGNNFWGVEQFTSGCDRLIAASDRDFGLYIFKYTGPGAAQPCTPQPPVATPQPSAPAPVTPAAAVKDAAKPQVALLSSARQKLRTLRSSGLKFRMRVDEASKLEVTLRARFGKGKLQAVSRRATLNAAAGKTVTIKLKPTAAMRKKLRRHKRLSGVLTIKATDAAGNVTTRTKALSFR
jgi:hypothetical protein